jgi:hypothetical protein
LSFCFEFKELISLGNPLQTFYPGDYENIYFQT